MVGMLCLVQVVWATPKAMIIFDASGSMWGQVDGRSKIEIARQALGDLLRGWDPKTPLGLTVYGHRRKGDCNDIETMVPIGPVNKEKMIRMIDGIQPRGKTPIAEALRRVAASLRGSEDPVTVILISDGKESCGGDPCAVARELKASGINFVAHVIGFHVDRATDRELSCIARATGGEYFSARNAAALNRAIRHVAAKAVTLKAKPRPPKAKVPAKIELVAKYESERGSGVNSVGRSRAHWWVWQDGRLVYNDNGTISFQPTVPLHSGRARVKLQYLLSSRPQTIERNITVRGGEQRVLFYLKDGFVTVTATDGTQNVESDIHLYPIVDGKVREDEEVGWCVATRETPCRFNLPIGTYHLKARCNGATVEGDLEFRSGVEQPVTLQCPKKE
jgi:Ca-activated chloride channel family protein